MKTAIYRLSEQGQRLFWFLFICTILVIYGMQITGKPLINDTAPAGIVSFEFAGSLERSHEIISSWQGEALGWAKINMVLDFIFLTCYGLTIALASLLLGARLGEAQSRIRTLSIWSAGIVLVAASLDIFENLALLALLYGWDQAFLPFLAKWCAIPKFFLVAVSLIYVLVGVLLLLVQGWKQRQAGATA